MLDGFDEIVEIVETCLNDHLARLGRTGKVAHGIVDVEHEAWTRAIGFAGRGHPRVGLRIQAAAIPTINVATTAATAAVEPRWRRTNVRAR